VCHGIIPAEKPGRGDLVAFTSEEIRDHWNADGPIIRQPIDLGFWSPEQNPQIYLTRFSYRGGLPFFSALAASMGLAPQHLRNANPKRARSVIRQSTCVIATGRAALEAMACNIPVVICDHRSAYQGPLMDLDIQGAMTRNYSGRGGVVPIMENVKRAIDSVMTNGFPMRNHVLKYHDSKNIVDQLLELA
jgi:hypothetical protein